MYSKQDAQILSLTAAESITAKHIVALDGTHTANKAVGVALNDVDTDCEISLVTAGITAVIAGSAVAVGDLVTADADGKAVPVTPANIAVGSSVEVLGYAVVEADAEDEDILVFVNPAVIMGTLPDPALHTMSITAAEAITANHIVAYDGTHTANKGIGVAQNSAASAAAVELAISGIATVVAGAEVTAGAYVTADADGKAVPVVIADIATGTVVEVLGHAVTGAAAEDAVLTVLICPSIVLGTKTT